MSLMWRLGWWLLAVVVGLALGFALSSGLFYLATNWNNALTIQSVEATAKVGSSGKQRWLDVRYGVAILPRCPSWTQHTVYRDVAQPDGSVQRQVVPLGITVNGLGSPSDKTQFDIPFALPASVSTGAWLYTAITSISCEWMPGLVRQQVQETAPIAVFVPKGD